MGDTPLSFVCSGQCGPAAKELGVLVNRLLTNFRKATREHFHCSKYQQATLEAATAFTAAMKNPEVAVDRRLSSERSKHDAENQLKLWSIAETVIFCGR